MHLSSLSRYWKTLLSLIPLVSLLVGELIEAVKADSDGNITDADWRNIGLSLVASVLVYAKANTPPPSGPRADMSETER